MDKMLDIGVIGLSVMGSSLALNMADHGFAVGGYNRSAAVTQALTEQHPHPNFTAFYSLPELVAALEKPRRVFLMVKAGAPVDALIAQLAPLLEAGDILMDGGNSYFEDTNRRAAALREKGIVYYGVGVSGGEEGARHGPSVMPGGDKAAYGRIAPVLEAIAAKAGDGSPCCAYMGPDGAGHYVKMVHNGIEYADMQLIAESYLLLRTVGGFTNSELSGLFREWNKGELHSFLIEITADILAEQDDLVPGALVDVIEDSAQQKGTGRWASIEALRQGAHLSMITEACNARILSNLLDERAAASRVVEAPAVEKAADKDKFAEEVRRGLYTAKIAAYAQGMRLLRDASEAYGWKLELGRIAAIFRAGCIIQAAFLDDITRAFERDARLSNLMMDPFFAQGVNAGQGALRRCAAQGILSGIPLPVFTAACAYLDGWRGAPVGANLIQAQRDLFGAHTYRRTDRKGVFHHEWRRDNG